jgi:hypothetical protein
MYTLASRSNSMGTEEHSVQARKKWICKLLCVRSWQRPKFRLKRRPTYKIQPRFKRISLEARLHLQSRSNLMIPEVLQQRGQGNVQLLQIKSTKESSCYVSGPVNPIKPQTKKGNGTRKRSASKEAPSTLIDMSKV